MSISMHHLFERRIGLFPAGFDEEGNMFCNQNFADYPLEIPEGDLIRELAPLDAADIKAGQATHR